MLRSYIIATYMRCVQIGGYCPLHDDMADHTILIPVPIQMYCTYCHDMDLDLIPSSLEGRHSMDVAHVQPAPPLL